MKITGLSTPALVLDVNILKANAAAMEKILAGTSLKLRPHYKSHKCAALAKWQMKNGAVGMTCAKLCEAEDLSDIGIEDILIANQIVDPAKILRAADLAGNCHLTVCVDTVENVKAFSAAAVAAGNTVYCFVEFEIGMQRCGVSTKEAVLTLAKAIIAAENLEFAGIQAYAGHISHIEDQKEREEMTAANYAKLRELLGFLQENGVEVKTVSGGSTGTAQIKAMEGLYTELQAGSYLFMDAVYRNLNLPFQNALFLLSTVVSQKEDLTIMDAGIKIKKPVSGIAMGLISDSKTGKYAVLSDILGDEDHLGDMDFKVTGTVDGITATQMDIKVDGLSYEVLEKALEQARQGRMHIMGEMMKTISEPRPELKPHTPRIVQLRVPGEFIGAIIGKGGEVIQKIQKETGTTVTITEVKEGNASFGVVDIFGENKESMDAALAWVKGIVTVPEVGTIYKGKVVSILEFGAFVEILPGKEGLLHISELDWKKVEKTEDVLNVGDEVEVKLLEIDSKTGKMRLSRKVLLEKPEGYVEPVRRPRPEGDRKEGNRGPRKDFGKKGPRENHAPKGE